MWWYQKMKPFQFHLIWRLLNTFHIPEIPNKVGPIIWTNVLWMSFDYKRNQPDRILSQKCWRQKALIEVSTRLSWFPASVLSSHSRQFTRWNLRKSIPFPKSQFFFFLTFNISSLTKKTFHFSGVVFCSGVWTWLFPRIFLSAPLTPQIWNKRQRPSFSIPAFGKLS